MTRFGVMKHLRVLEDAGHLPQDRTGATGMTTMTQSLGTERGF
jgi:hypothetical protein